VSISYNSKTNATESSFPEGNAIVYCEGSFNTTYGKTAHGLVRFTRRYRVVSVVDSRYAGGDAGKILDGEHAGIPIHASIKEAVKATMGTGSPATHLVMGIAPDGGVLDETARRDVLEAINLGLNIDSGLHRFLSEDDEIRQAAEHYGVALRDIRRPPERGKLHFFSGKIEQVDSLKIAVLGTDSAVGKRTTAWLLVQALEKDGVRAELIGTGQTAWMQGARYSIVMDALVNDFVSGEIEHAVWMAWNEQRPEVIVLEGQGSLMNPAYPGGFELLAAGRPDIVILQHAPARKDYDGFPGYPIHPLARQIEVVRMLSGKPVVAVAVNHEDMSPEQIPVMCDAIGQLTGLPAVDVLMDGAAPLVQILRPYLENKK
jgi:uncharacterized NAD-dependent epimerase/dehydratase family protein